MSGFNNGGDDKRKESTSKNVRERAKEIEDRIKRGSSVQNASKGAKKTQDDKDRQGHKSISNPVLKEHAHTEWQDGALVTEVDTYIYDEDKSNEDKSNEDKGRGNRSSIVAASTATKKADEEFFAAAKIKGEEETEFRDWRKRVFLYFTTTDMLGLRSYVARRLVANEVATGDKVKESTVPKDVYEAIVKQRAAVKTAKTTDILERSGVRVSYAQLLDTPIEALNEGAKAASRARGDSSPEESQNFYKMVLSIISKDVKSSRPVKFVASTASAAASSLKGTVSSGVNAMKRVGSKEDVLRRPAKGADGRHDDPLFNLELEEEESTQSISGPTNVKKADSRFENGELRSFNKPFTRDTVHANEAKRKADEMAARRKVEQSQVQRTKKNPPPVPPKRPDQSKRRGYDGRPKNT